MKLLPRLHVVKPNHCWFEPVDVPRTMAVPIECLKSVNKNAVELQQEVLQWLGANVGMNGYAVRTVEMSFINPDLRRVWRDHPLNIWREQPPYNQHMAFITFEDDVELLHFKMMWS